MPMTPLCTTPSLIDTKSTGTADDKERCCRTLDRRPFSYFRLGQKRLSFLQCLKNSISSSINSYKIVYTTIPCSSTTQLSPSPILISLGLFFTLNLNFMSCLLLNQLPRGFYRLQQFPPPPSIAYNIQKPSPPLYGIRMTCGGRFNT